MSRWACARKPTEIRRDFAAIDREWSYAIAGDTRILKAAFQIWGNGDAVMPAGYEENRIVLVLDHG